MVVVVFGRVVDGSVGETIVEWLRDARVIAMLAKQAPAVNDLVFIVLIACIGLWSVF